MTTMLTDYFLHTIRFVCNLHSVTPQYLFDIIMINYNREKFTNKDFFGTNKYKNICSLNAWIRYNRDRYDLISLHFQPLLVVIPAFRKIFRSFQKQPNLRTTTTFRTQKIGAVVDKRSLFRGYLGSKSSRWDHKTVVFIDRWSLFGGGR
jgi:hypothetical protein